MRRHGPIALLLLLPGCGLLASDLVAPEEFHLWGAYHDTAGDGTWSRQEGSGGYRAAWEGDGYSVGAGFTWSLSAKSPEHSNTSRALERLLVKLEERELAPPPVTPPAEPDPEPPMSPPLFWSPFGGYPLAVAPSSPPDETAPEPGVVEEEAKRSIVWALSAVGVAVLGWLARRFGAHEPAAPA